MYYELSDHFIVPADMAKTWAFFSRAQNLPDLTPPWLKFRITTREPIVLQQDSVIDYNIRWMGFPIHWRTLIVDWQPPTRFADLQIKGPYALWLHQHTFEAIAEGVACRDRVIYKLPGGILAPAVQRLAVRRQLLEIFRFRREAIREKLGWVRALQAVAVRRL